MTAEPTAGPRAHDSALFGARLRGVNGRGVRASEPWARGPEARSRDGAPHVKWQCRQDVGTFSLAPLRIPKGLNSQ
jgi:hypothetical protein